MRILVTGGAGYIGSHTCVELLNRGYQIAVIDNFYNSKPECIKRVKKLTGKDFNFYECDILDRKRMTDIFALEKPTAVVHFAGLKAVGESVNMPLNYYQNNVTGTLMLLMCMAEAGVKSIIFSSTATVYGVQDSVIYTEDMTTGGCSNPYSWSKCMIEQMIMDLYLSDSEWNATILRYFNPIGAHESGYIGEDPNGVPNNLMPYITQVAIGKREYLNIYGDDYDTHDGTGVRDYIHVVDLAVGHILAVERMGGLRAYNLGTGKGVSVLEVHAAMEKQIGRAIPYKIVPRRAGDLAMYYAKVDKARNELGFIAQYDIERMCADSWRWQKNNPNGM